MSGSVADRINVKGVVRGGSSQVKIPPHALVIEEGANSRRWTPDVDELVESILVNGQEQDIAIRIDGGGKPVVVWGERRARALQQIEDAKLADPPMMAKCTVVNRDNAGAFLLSIAENHDREQPTAIDDAYAISRLVATEADGGFGKTQREAAAIFHKHPSWVSLTLSLMSLPVAIQKDVHKGKIPVTAGYELATMQPGQRARMLKELAEEKLEVTAAEIKRRLRTWTESANEEFTDAGVALDADPEPASDVEREPTDESGEVEEGEPKPKKNKRVSKAAAASTAGRSQRALKEIKLYFDAQAAVSDEGEDPDVWQELCGYVRDWVEGKLSDRQLTTRGKKACGIEE
jgi:ParB/RepB/Spo0J family partition protein